MILKKGEREPIQRLLENTIFSPGIDPVSPTLLSLHLSFHVAALIFLANNRHYAYTYDEVYAPSIERIDEAEGDEVKEERWKVISASFQPSPHSLIPHLSAESIHHFLILLRVAVPAHVHIIRDACLEKKKKKIERGILLREVGRTSFLDSIHTRGRRDLQRSPGIGELKTPDISVPSGKTYFHLLHHLSHLFFVEERSFFFVGK